MHGHHHDAVGILVVIIHVGVQRNVGKIALKRRRIGLALVVHYTRAKLFYILRSRIVLDGVLFLKHTEVARLFEQQVVQQIGSDAL